MGHGDADRVVAGGDGGGREAVAFGAQNDGELFDGGKAGIGDAYVISSLHIYAACSWRN